MLLTVEGGGFFSSSASGYRNGLALIFLGQQQQNQGEIPLKLSTSWTSRYKLIQQEEAAYLEFQLASKKNRVSSHRCTSFVCFRPSSTGLETPPPLQYRYGCSETCHASYQNVNYSTDQENDAFYLKSSLRKPSDHCAATACEDDGELGQNRNGFLGCSEGKKVHWTDACGKELAEIREFEVSDESASDSEEESRRGCTCAIM